MRYVFGREIARLAEKDDSIVVLVGDIGYGVFDEFREKFPERFFNLGTIEQSMVGIAAGMALSGLKPYVYTITPFLIERAFEQIKLDVDEMKLNVKLVGYADYPNQGPTHRELDGKKLMRILRNTKSYFPRTATQTYSAIHESYESKLPTFISLKQCPSKK